MFELFCLFLRDSQRHMTDPRIGYFFVDHPALYSNNNVIMERMLR